MNLRSMNLKEDCLKLGCETSPICSIASTCPIKASQLEMIGVCVITIVYALLVGVVIVFGHGSAESMYLATSLTTFATFAAGYIKTNGVLARITKSQAENQRKTENKIDSASVDTGHKIDSANVDTMTKIDSAKDELIVENTRSIKASNLSTKVTVQKAEEIKTEVAKLVEVLPKEVAKVIPEVLPEVHKAR